MRHTALALLAAAVFVGCSGDGGGSGGGAGGGDDGPAAPAVGSAEEVVEAALEATLAEGSARTEFTTELTGLTGTDETLTVEGEGLVDLERRRSTVTVDLGPVLAGLGLPGIGGEVETRAVEGTTWFRSPFFNSVLGVQTDWVRVDTGAAPDAGDGLAQLTSLAGNDPGDQLRLLARVEPDSVEEVGDEDLRGDATTRYRASVVPQAALADQLGPGPLDVDVWVDGDGRVRRLGYTADLPPAAGGGTAAVELEYFAFGTDVDVEPPPDADVTPAEDITDPGP